VNDNEPWLPPGHAERLTVGTRVIVRPSPECRETWHSGDDGLIGTIMTTTMVEPGITEPDFGHSYAVQWGSYPPTKGHPCGLTWYAAAELEPVETIADHNARVWNERVVRDGQRGSVTGMGMIITSEAPAP
jgi:hypothetical protein